MSMFLYVVRDYLGMPGRVPETDGELVRAALALPRGQLQESLANGAEVGSTPWKSAGRQIQRWIVQFAGIGPKGGTQARGKTEKVSAASRVKLRRALIGRKAPAHVIVSGVVRYSDTTYEVREKRIPSAVTAEHFLGILALAAAAEAAGIDPEEFADNVLAGIYFEEPEEPIEIGGKVVATVPWNEEFAWEDCEFEIVPDREDEPPRKKKRRRKKKGA